MIIFLVPAAIVGYLLGSLNSSLIVGKFYGIDVRKHGSGNAGTTNTLRTLGKKAALFVLAGDMLKGILAYLIGFYLSGQPIGGMIGGLSAIIGHNWPVYFGFKGGRGVLTSLAVLLMMDWKIALLLLGVFIIIVAIARYVSLGSIISAALFPVLSLILDRSIQQIILSAIIGLMIIILHKDNIKRLLSGTENKLGAKKQKDVSREDGNA
jgi:glycerol-3-phosphate acyltransferase PlsY